MASVFKSGISVAPAKTAPARNIMLPQVATDDMINALVVATFMPDNITRLFQPPKTSWGAPEPRNIAPEVAGVEIVDDDEANKEVVATALDKETQEFMDVDQNDKHSLRSPPKRLESAKVKKVKIDQAPPWQDQFNVTSNGGEGDCAYISIAQCLAQENGTLKKAKKDDFKPKGRLQAQLRVLASQELSRRKAFYVKEHGSSVVEGTLIARTWADSVSLYALAHATHLDIRIWSFENILQQWNFYQIRPDVPKKPDVAKKHQETVAYLKLTRKRYEWLRPSQEIPAELELQWPNAVKLRPPSLSCGGKKGSISGSSHHAMSVLGLKHPAPSSSHDPRSILGLNVASSSSATSSPRSAASILGLKRSKRAKKAHQPEDLDKLSEIFFQEMSLSPEVISGAHAAGHPRLETLRSSVQTQIPSGRFAKEKGHPQCPGRTGLPSSRKPVRQRLRKQKPKTKKIGTSGAVTFDLNIQNSKTHFVTQTLILFTK